MTARYVSYVLCLAAAGALAAWARMEDIPPAGRAGVFIGIGVAAAAAISWIGAAGWAAGRGHRAFMSALALGMLGRLVIYSATLIYVALRTGIDLLWTAGALLGFHLVSIVLEVRFAIVAGRAGSVTGGPAARGTGTTV